jgi:hypothetical protein
VHRSEIGVIASESTHDHDFEGIEGLRLVSLHDPHPEDFHCTNPAAEDTGVVLKASAIVSPTCLLH